MTKTQSLGMNMIKICSNAHLTQTFKVITFVSFGYTYSKHS